MVLTYHECNNVCFESKLQASWKFNAMVTQVLLYGVEVWGDTISLNAWNEIEKIRDMFLRRQLGVKSTTSSQVMLLETSVQPIGILALQRVYTLQKLRICQIIYYHILLGMWM